MMLWAEGAVVRFPLFTQHASDAPLQASGIMFGGKKIIWLFDCTVGWSSGSVFKGAVAQPLDHLAQRARACPTGTAFGRARLNPSGRS